jgi:hypothetical protein
MFQHEGTLELRDLVVGFWTVMNFIPCQIYVQNNDTKIEKKSFVFSIQNIRILQSEKYLHSPSLLIEQWLPFTDQTLIITLLAWGVRDSTW